MNNGGLTCVDDRFIAKEISRLEMDALTKFAPAYFEYTRKAFQGHVSLVPLSVTRLTWLAPKRTGQNIWLLQDRLSQRCDRQIYADERPDHGESLLRPPLLQGEWTSQEKDVCADVPDI